MHRITRGPLRGDFRRGVRSQPAPECVSSTPPPGAHSPGLLLVVVVVVEVGGLHRSASPFKGDGERGRCAAGALFSSSLSFMLNRLQVLAELYECEWAEFEN